MTNPQWRILRGERLGGITTSSATSARLMVL
jgi:hypothetical protein